MSAMEILADERKNIPVTVTLKAETLMQFMVQAVTMPQIQATEVVKIKEAIAQALGV